jgi:hypothetical protein
VAQRAHVNKLKADVQSLEQGAKRLSGGVKSQEVPGRNLRSVAGDGDRQYLSGLKVGGKRIFLLVDASASMLAEDIVNAVRRKLFPPETAAARKWRQVVKAATGSRRRSARGATILRVQHADARARGPRAYGSPRSGPRDARQGDRAAGNARGTSLFTPSRPRRR